MNNPNYLKEINIHAPSNRKISQNSTDLSKINILTKESIIPVNHMKTFSHINHIGNIRSNSDSLTSKQVSIRFSELTNKNENITLNKNVHYHNISSNESFPISFEKDKNNISSPNYIRSNIIFPNSQNENILKKSFIDKSPQNYSKLSVPLLDNHLTNPSNNILNLKVNYNTLNISKSNIINPNNTNTNISSKNLKKENIQSNFQTKELSHNYLKSESIKEHIIPQNILPNIKANFHYKNNLENHDTIKNNLVSLPFSGKDLLKLYNVKEYKNNNGISKVKIAIIIAYSYNAKTPGSTLLQNDLKTYWKSNFGQNSNPPTITIKTMPGAIFDDGWAMEECLDLQMIATINPNADIHVVEAKSSSLNDLMVAINYASNIIKAHIISMSWGSNDSNGLIPYNNNFTNPNICYCASTGDDNYVSWPSVLSNCMAIGGTSLYNSNNNRTETTWTSAGCGYSSSILKPSYQKNISQITGTNRAIPDISLVANPNTGVKIYYNKQWIQIGGTSLSCQLFAGMISLFNQNRLNKKLSTLTSVCKDKNGNLPINNIQTYLYTKIYNNITSYKNIFYDITSGSDKGSKQDGNLTDYSASTNYDIPTGLGSINCDQLCQNILNFKHI